MWVCVLRTQVSTTEQLTSVVSEQNLSQPVENCVCFSQNMSFPFSEKYLSLRPLALLVWSPLATGGTQRAASDADVYMMGTLGEISQALGG